MHTFILHLIMTTLQYLLSPLSTGLNLHRLCTQWLSLNDCWCESARLCRALIILTPARLAQHERLERPITSSHLAEFAATPSLVGWLTEYFQQLVRHNDVSSWSDAPLPILVDHRLRGTAAHHTLCRIIYYTRVTAYQISSSSCHCCLSTRSSSGPTLR
jgi:hypothetical protein